MKSMNVFAILSVGWIIASSVSAADETTASGSTAGGVPTVDQLLEKHISAIGGRPALEKVQSRTIKGTLEMPSMGMNVSWEQQTKAPNRRLVTLEIPGMGKVLEGFDGTTAWSKAPGAVIQEKKGEELARLQRECQFNRELKFTELFKQIKVQGLQKVEGKDAYALEAIPAQGAPETFFFDAKTGLLLRWDSSFKNDVGETRLQVVYQDFREIDGIRLPFLNELTLTAPNIPEMSLKIRASEIRHNMEMEEAQFKKPAE